MKKYIPVFIAIALICIVVMVNFGRKVEEKYSYGTDRADLTEYFGVSDPTVIPIVLQDSRIEETAKLIDGVVYFDIETVEELFTCRFYYDYNEKLLLYTNPKGTIRNEVGTSVYTEEGMLNDCGYKISVEQDNTLYIAADYIRKFINYYYDYFPNPNRMQLYTEWGEKTIAGIEKDTQVRWKGGVKSEILTDIKEGDVVEILEVMDEWTKVKTEDAFIGYVPNSTLGAAQTLKENRVADVPEEVFPSLTKNEKINLVWHNIEYPQDTTALFNACAYIKSVNVISPTWYWLTDNEGNFKSVASEEYVPASTRMGMEVWPLISDFHGDTDVDILEVLSYTSKREYLINNLVAETMSYGAKGINVDFETIKSVSAPHFLQFIRELSVACHKAGLVLSVDNFVPTEYTAHYNRGEQSIFADYIIIMGYDEHYAGSEIGSVASVSWMKKGIEDTIARVPANKVINAIPFYTRVWKTSGSEVTSEAIDMKVQKEFVSKHKIKPTWDDATNQNYGETTADGIHYQVWLEDAESIKVRLSVMSTFDIAGVAAWKLGQETRDVWDVIEAYMNQ